jgi:hypothetical protein
MSIIHVTQIASKIKPLFETKMDSSDIRISDPERDTKILTRCLAAYAVYNHTNCTPEEAALSLIDGGDDNGIDAIYYSASLKELVLVQSKWIKSGSGEPDSSEIMKFCAGIEDLLKQNFERFNAKVSKRELEIISAISAFDTKYLVILAYTGDKGIAEHGQRKIDDLLNKLNDTGDDNVEDLIRFVKFDQSKIYKSLTKGLISGPIDITIGLHQWGKYSEPYSAFFGYVSGEEIAKIWEENGRKLFHKNIRNVLGKTDVNEELLMTIQNTPEKFWYFNNGITITSDSIEKSMVGGTNRDLGSFKLINASIVNGAQTISSIGEIASKFPEQIKKVYVLTRFISLQQTPTEFGNEVTKANNRQNRIENRDFASQDHEQSRLREELAHDGLSYTIVRSDQFLKSPTSFDVEEATLSLACASKQVSLSVQAKRELGKFYEDLTRGIYKQIFNTSTTGRYLANCIFINRKIEELITNKISSLDRKAGKEYGILVHGNRMLSLLIFQKINISYSDLMKIDDLNLEHQFQLVLNKMKTSIDSSFSENFLPALFKNKSKCDALAILCR